MPRGLHTIPISVAPLLAYIYTKVMGHILGDLTLQAVKLYSAAVPVYVSKGNVSFGDYGDKGL